MKKVAEQKSQAELEIEEWIGIYRAVTGACAIGVKMFVETTGKSLDDNYTAKEIVELVKGQYGADRFADKVKEAA